MHVAYLRYMFVHHHIIMVSAFAMVSETSCLDIGSEGLMADKYRLAVTEDRPVITQEKCLMLNKQRP